MNVAALTPSALWSLCKDAASAWSDDFAPSMGAAIAYYTAFSIAPLIVIVLAIFIRRLPYAVRATAAALTRRSS